MLCMETTTLELHTCKCVRDIDNCDSDRSHVVGKPHIVAIDNDDPLGAYYCQKCTCRIPIGANCNNHRCKTTE